MLGAHVLYSQLLHPLDELKGVLLIWNRPEFHTQRVNSAAKVSIHMNASSNRVYSLMEESEIKIKTTIKNPVYF